MPPKKSLKEVIRDCLGKLKNSDCYQILTENGGVVLFCKSCGHNVKLRKSKEPTAIREHHNSPSHIDKDKTRHSSGKSQQPLSFVSMAKQDIAYRVTKAFIEADIPLSKLDNKKFRDFLEWLFGAKLPSRTACRS